MLGSVAISPQMIETIFPIAFLASYAMLRRYRDPISCGNICKHLPEGACDYYDHARDASSDLRKIKVVTASVPIVASSAADEKKEAEIFPYIYTVFAALIGTITLAPAIFYVTHRIRHIRLKYHRCRCAHAETCHLGKSHFLPPAGCEDWIFRNGGYDRPDRLEWVPGIKISPSSASSAHA
jgi:hypothetical protein